ncbi:MAG: tetratricopeptide repeat protein [Candidatus Korobacteraceae bacterium]
MKKYIYLASLLFAISIFATPLWAQVNGDIRGVATDRDGKPISGATVEISDAATGRKYTAKTNAKGQYVAAELPIGNYSAVLVQNGNTVDEHHNIPVTAGQEMAVDFNLAKDVPVSAEQQKKVEAVQKQNMKVKELNAKLAQAKELEAAGNYDQAITLLQQTTESDPSQDLLWAYLGDAQRGAKKYTDAIESYQKAIAIKPTSGAYHSGLADAYAKSGQTDKAVQEYAAAAEADPTNAGTYYFNEGAIFTNIGKVDEAVAAFDKAIQIDPKRADSYYWKGVDLIGKATMKDNKMVAPPGTAEAFNKYLELAPSGKYADAAKQMLATIGAPVDTSYGKSKKKSSN